MNIVYLHQYFRTPQMGGGTRSYAMAKKMVQCGHEVHMITINTATGKNDLWTTTCDSGIHVHWLGLSYSNRLSNFRRMSVFAAFAVLAAKKAVSLRPDVVFASSTPLTVALPAILASKLRRVPMVFEVRDLWPEVPIALGQLRNPVLKRLAIALERAAYSSSREVVALSPGMKAGVVTAGFPEGQVTVIPNSCDLELFDVGPNAGLEFRNQQPWLGDRPLVVYTGTLGLVNGVEYLVKLAAEVHQIDPEIRFLVVGTGRQERSVRAMALEKGVLNRVFFMSPPTSKFRLAEILSAATIATSTVIDVPELWNNSANKFFDSLAASRPIAINHEGWQADMIRERDIGIVLDAHDVAGAARLLAKKIRDLTWLEHAGRNARLLGEARFSRDDLASQLIEVIERAVK